MSGLKEYCKIIDAVANAIETLPRRTATEAVNFSEERFRQQNWIDTTTEPWKKRKISHNTKHSRRAILVDIGRLKRSIRVLLVSTNRIVIGTDVPYAQAHNDGFKGLITQNVRKHQRISRKGRSHTVEAHSRTIKQNIPKRRFIGASNVLNGKIERMMTVEIIKAIKHGHSI